jgi:hypothetical protein
MINYILLVSRQGMSLRLLARDVRLSSCREGSPREMVHDSAAQAEGEDREGRHAARPRPPDAHVQLSRVQGSVDRRPAPRPFRNRAHETAFPDTKVVYRRYASLFFVCGITGSDNELVTLEIVHRYVEVLDRYFGNVRPPVGSRAARLVAAER